VNPQNLTTLSDYLNVLRRRAWIAVLCVIVAAGSAYFYSKHQTPEYRATATVGLSKDPISALIANSRTSQTDLLQYIAGQVQFADSATTAAATLSTDRAKLAAAGITGMTPSQFLSRTSVTGDTTNDLVTFTATGRTRPQALALVNAYAEIYVARADANDHLRVKTALAPINAELSTLNAQLKADQAKQAAGQNMNSDIQLIGQQMKGPRNQKSQLLAAAQGIEGSRNLHAAESAAKVRPILSHNVGIGVALGLVIGLTLIGLSEALDNRVRRSEDLSLALGMTMLTKIPTPPRSFRKGNRLGMMEDDHDAHTEAYRKLRVNFDFANLGPRAKLVMLTSAVEQEGKSTTISNLAVAFARAGRKVALVDLDLRRPALHRFFGIENGFGVSDVALGHVESERALHRVEIPGATGTLEIMPTGPVPPHPADFLETPAVAELLQDLSQRYDVVLVDSAPILPVSDSVILSRRVHAIMVVARVSTLKRQVLAEFHQALAALTVPKLGFILTAAEDEAAGYGAYGSYGSYGPSAPEPAAGRGEGAEAGASGDAARVSSPRTAGAER
jgi:tyrosine-protein kinase